MFDKSYLNHNFILIEKNPEFFRHVKYSTYHCEKCNIVINIYHTHPDIPYLVIDDLYVRLILSCEEIIIKNIIE